MIYAGQTAAEGSGTGAAGASSITPPASPPSLAYVALHQQDSAGLAVFDQKVRHFIKPSNNPRQWRHHRRTHHRAQKSKDPHRGDPRRNGRAAAPPLLIVLISDLFDIAKDIIKAFSICVTAATT